MTQDAKRPQMKWLVSIPSDDSTTFGRNCLKAACRGNDKMGALLNYFAFEASIYADRQKIEGDVKVVVLQRTLDEILEGINHSISKKTLIAYLKKFNDWEMVASQSYHKDYAVNIEKINEAIKNPPAPEIKPRGRPRSKGCSNLPSENTTTLQPSQVELAKKVEDLQQKVVELQSQVVNLQLQIVKLQPKVVNLQPFNSCEAASHAGSNGFSASLDLETDSRLTETKESILPATPSQTIPTHDASASDIPSLFPSEPSIQKQEITPTTKPREVKPKKLIPQGPLVMPPDDAKWCAETAVQIVEAKKGRRYGEKTRNQEIARARDALSYTIKDEPLTRDQFENAWDNMAGWKVWAESKTEPMIKHLLKDDRIVSLAQRQLYVIKPTSTPSTNSLASQMPPRVQSHAELRKVPY